MPTEALGCCFKISTASWYHGNTNVTKLADSIQLRQVTVRIMRIGRGSRERTVSNVLRRRNMSPPGGTTRPPTPGHRIRLQRAVLDVRPFAPVSAALGEGAKFREDAHQQLLTALHVELAIDAPQIGVHGMR